MRKKTIERLHSALDELLYFDITGRVDRVVGTVVRAKVPRARVGDLCLLRERGWERYAEVVGLEPGIALLSPMGELSGVSSRTEVILTDKTYEVEIGNHLLGCVLDGFGNVLDTQYASKKISDSVRVPVDAAPPDPIARRIISNPISVGVRAIDGLLTCAEGQRVGIFAAAGVGKTSLLSMLVNGTEADVCVVGLVGERGREVREFIERELGEAGRRRSVIVVATADRPAGERLKAGFVATTIAEYFREQGKRVLLLMDSVTRLARAQREIGLAVGEFPARRGFPPSVFSMLPRLFERAGMSTKGSITAFYTVLVEGDDMTEPVADEVRSLLDGHIVMSRDLAAENHYPAIDILASISRVMTNVIQKDHRQLAGRFRALLSKYKEIELLLRLGEYQKGNDELGDEAQRKIEGMRAYLRQSIDQYTRLQDAVKGLRICVG